MTGRARIEIREDRMEINLAEGNLSLPVRSLPPSFVTWFQQGKLGVYRQLLTDPAKVDFFHQHLPMLVTYGQGSPFFFNCGNKGVGFLPREEHLDHYIRLYRETIEATRSSPWRTSLPRRIEAARTFHEDTEAIDFRCLTSIEIFRKRTFSNLRAYPLSSLLFTGAMPEYKSFQVNCAVEIIGREDPRFTFVSLSRRLFEFDAFHIAQPDFDYGYIFWISEILDKTPHRVAERPVGRPEADHLASLSWDEEALAMLAAVPAWHRGQVKTQIERYGLERGFNRITSEVVGEARAVLRH